MDNIFKNAYFGKAYKTRDGRKALYFYQTEINKWHELIVEGETISLPYQDNGLAVEQHLKDPEWPEDIVSEWQEEINEEELDELALEYFNKQWRTSYKSLKEITDDLDMQAVDDFKAGYRKTLEL